MAFEFAVALDWTPNTNHVGLYVARAKGWYREADLNVNIISPHTDDYKVTPASRVANGEAVIAIAPSETVISYQTAPAQHGKPKLRAVAAVLQNSTHAIVTLASSGIDRPRKLDGKTYASYGARYEGRIVQQMIKNDGGTGEYKEEALPMLGIWNTLLRGTADATWVFMGWEGVQASLQGVDLNVFKLEDYGIPYGYSPVMVANDRAVNENSDALRAFLSATSRGYIYAAQHAEEAATLLCDGVAADTASHPLPTPLQRDMVVASMRYLAPHFTDAQGRWGTMSIQRWDAFLDWLSDNGLLTTKVQSREPMEGVSTTLDALRAGDVGDVIHRHDILAKNLFSNDLLP